MCYLKSIGFRLLIGYVLLTSSGCSVTFPLIASTVTRDQIVEPDEIHKITHDKYIRVYLKTGGMKEGFFGEFLPEGTAFTLQKDARHRTIIPFDEVTRIEAKNPMIGSAFVVGGLIDTILLLRSLDGSGNSHGGGGSSSGYGMGFY